MHEMSSWHIIRQKNEENKRILWDSITNFINKTRQEESQISLPFNFGLPYAKSLEHYDDQEVEAMFQFVVKQ